MDQVDHDRLVEIHEEMKDLIREASTIVREADYHEYQRAKGYWIGHIEHSLERINPYDHCTMADTIRSLESCIDDSGDEKANDEDSK